jgi:RimJ/RimL family protein N-acetyltransferase
MARVRSRFVTADGRTITLRPLKRSDLPLMLPFVNAFVKERKTNADLGITGFYRRMTLKDEKQFLLRTLEMESKGKGVSVGAFHEGRLVAHCDVSGRDSPDESHTALLGIVVVDGYRGVGLGGEMIRTALEEARRLGLWMVELEVFANNAPAVHLYAKFGFKEVGVIPKKIRRRGRYLDIIRMYAHLPHN